eukprot:SAG31_NODE_16378_length_711_cov_1.214052_1_plen_27_part_10
MVRRANQAVLVEAAAAKAGVAAQAEEA